MYRWHQLLHHQMKRVSLLAKGDHKEMKVHRDFHNLLLDLEQFEIVLVEFLLLQDFQYMMHHHQNLLDFHHLWHRHHQHEQLYYMV
jgi:hypothetical protein